MTGPEVSLRVADLSRRFGTVVALDRVNLEVRRGETMALLGPSGSGKTTALRLMAGFDRPDSGTVELGGRFVAGVGAWVPPERRRIGFVAQDLSLFPHLDVRRNIGYGLRNMARHERDARVLELLAMVGLEGSADRMPHQLSGGMAQRVALCRAMAPRPDVVLLDEPFSSLDQVLRVQLRDEVRALLRRAGQTAVVVTHDQQEALAMADRVAVMRAGHIEQVDAPEVVHARPATPWVARFLGAGTLVPTTIGNGLAVTEMGSIRLLAEPPVTADVCLIRSEHLELTSPGEGTVPAVVIARRFEGSHVVLDLELPSGLRIRGDAPAALRAVSVGAELGVSLQRDPGTVAFVDDAA
ncbi:MAG: ABC transporter ATP-binding protein [Chloroflexi bacterium]|nr:ABC transporter ATP-binding protein [Chloroflexota bacterium]